VSLWVKTACAVAQDSTIFSGFSKTGPRTKYLEMKRTSLFSTLLVALCGAILSGCGGSGYKYYKGQLLGTPDRPDWKPVEPYGMVYIPSGTFHIGPSDEDYNHALWQRSKAVSIQGFYMDETEITNNEYRQFVYWVRDSIAMTILGGDYLLTNESTGTEQLNWDDADRIDWEAGSEEAMQLEEMFHTPENSVYGRRELDKSILVYDWEWFDWKKAASKKYNPDRDAPRSDFIVKEQIRIYPDTLTWVHDFAYGYNEPMTRQYFHHPAFDDYPVVGVNWKQANAFCTWRTRFWNDWRAAHREYIIDPFRLPYEAEWEYAARGGREHAPYPWGGPYVRNNKGCILANFKPGRGNYPEDGGFYTVRADAYWPNDWGLYNMAGNVAEWTSSAFHENSYSFVDDLNPDYRYDVQEEDNPTQRRKVIRGGSWKDIGYYIQTGSRHYEYQDTAKCYVGFRCVMTFLGRSMSDY
jgi:gliding motility-associated lipoprotein GldK